MMGRDLKCPWCNRWLVRDFVGTQFSLKCDCGVIVTLQIPQKLVDKVPSGFA